MLRTTWGVCVLLLCATAARAQDGDGDGDGDDDDASDSQAEAPTEGPGAVAAVTQAAHDCRDHANNLRSIAADCRRDLANGAAETCTVDVKGTSKGDISLSPDEADAVADRFDGVATSYDQALPDVERKEKQIIQDQRAFRVLRIVKTANDFVAWDQLAQDAQDEFRKATLQAVASVGVAAGLKKLESIHLTPAKAKDLIARLKADGVDDAELFEDLTTLAHSHAHHAKIENGKKVFERLGQMNDAMGTMDAKGEELVLKTDAMLMQWLVDDPELQLLVTDVDWTIQAIYSSAASNVALANINALNDMTEKDLKSIKILTGVLKKHTDDLVSYLKALPQCDY